MRRQTARVDPVVREWCLWVPLPHSKGKPKWINLNERAHWGSRSGKTAIWREMACQAAHQAGIPLIEKAWVVAHFSFGDNRRRDVHNYLPTAKACIDGFTDAGIWVDDNDEVLTGPDLRRGELEKKGIHFTIREVSGGDSRIHRNTGGACPWGVRVAGG